MTEAARSMAGIATKAGKSIFGAEAVKKAIRSNRCFLVLIDDLSSKRTVEEYTSLCDHYSVPILITQSPGSAMGRPQYYSMAITDKGLAQAVLDKLD